MVQIPFHAVDKFCRDEWDHAFEQNFPDHQAKRQDRQLFVLPDAGKQFSDHVNSPLISVFRKIVQPLMITIFSRG